MTSMDANCAFGSSSGGPNYGYYWSASGDKVPNIYTGMRIADAWSYSTGSGARVALIDTGIDQNNSELSGWTALSVNGESPQDNDDHGTHMAGAIGAPQNGQVIIGVAHESDHYSIRHGDDLWTVYDAWRIRDAVQKAIDIDADVVNMALHLSNNTSQVSDKIEEGYSRDVLFTAAAGSTGTTDIYYPADHPDVIAVTAVDYDTDQPFVCSHSGPEMEIAAYHGMPTTGHLAMDGGTEGESSASSNASAIVAGIAALVRGRYPAMSNTRVRALLQSTATDLGSAGRDHIYGYGLVNAYAAVLNLDGHITGPTYVTSEGTYTWEAVPLNGDGDYAYQWSVYWLESNVTEVLGTSKTQSLNIGLTSRGDFVMQLTITSAGLTTSDSFRVDDTRGAGCTTHICQESTGPTAPVAE